ncbi:hypothetical protein BGZ60DRAFT_437403 [Tricladium varicosporioides]|nr:hypothetical protein BGZ60DRAFT_437403 [Hymenoscyphus varicosporioides]
MDTYGAREVWDMLYENISQLVSLQGKYADIITPKQALPAEYIKTLLTFKYDLGQASKGFISLLKTGFFASPPMRQSFVWEPHISGSTMTRVMNRGGSDQSTPLLVGLPGLMDEIEHFVQSGSKEKAMLSPWTARELSDLGLIGRAMEYGADIEADFPRRFSTFAETEQNLKEASLVKALARYGTYYWNIVDEHYRRKTGRTFDRNVGVSQLERTLEWVESIKDQKTVLKQSSSGLHNPLSTLQLDSPDRPAKFAPPEQKTKPKTRGFAHDVTDNTQDITLQKAPDWQPTFTLKNRAYKVFKTLFFNPSQSDFPGEIPWADFLFAMASTAFAPEKLYGSVQQFTPTTLD